MILNAEHVTKIVNTSAGPLTIVDDVSVQLEAGQSLAIVGASGSGKSTLLGLLAGLDEPSSGSILLSDVNLTQVDEDARAALRAQSVGFVFQSFHLLPGLTALENVMLPLELHGQANKQDNKSIRATALQYLQQVGLQNRLQHYPKQLSGGEQQRVAIARAFATQPRILFADEPTGNLDAITGAHIIDLLFAMNQQQGTTLVLVTHEQRLASLCSKQLTLDAGRTVSVIANSSSLSAGANE